MIGLTNKLFFQQAEN